MKILTNKFRIEEAQQQFSRSISRFATETIPVTIGYQGGQFKTTVFWLNQLRFWAYFGFPPNEKSPGERYWNVFGLEKPSGLVNIVCEINSPLQGINRQAAGVFVENPSGRIILGHRGILNARGRIPKDFVFQNFRGKFIQIEDSGQISQIIEIGHLADSNFAEAVRDFIVEVVRVKELIRV